MLKENTEFVATRAEISDLLTEAAQTLANAALLQQCVSRDKTFQSNPEYLEIIKQLSTWFNRVR